MYHHHHCRQRCQPPRLFSLPGNEGQGCPFSFCWPWPPNKRTNDGGGGGFFVSPSIPSFNPIQWWRGDACRLLPKGRLSPIDPPVLQCLLVDPSPSFPPCSSDNGSGDEVRLSEGGDEWAEINRGEGWGGVSKVTAMPTE